MVQTRLVFAKTVTYCIKYTAYIGGMDIWKTLNLMIWEQKKIGKIIDRQINLTYAISQK